MSVLKHRPLALALISYGLVFLTSVAMYFFFTVGIGLPSDATAKFLVIATLLMFTVMIPATLSNFRRYGKHPDERKATVLKPRYLYTPVAAFGAAAVLIVASLSFLSGRRYYVAIVLAICSAALIIWGARMLRRN